MKQLTSNEVFIRGDLGGTTTFLIRPTGGDVVAQVNINGEWADMRTFSENDAVDIVVKSSVQWRFTIPAGSSVYYYI